MKLPPKITILDHFKDLEDKRVERTKRHKLIDIVTIAICAVICGADSWVLMETYGKKKKEWLKQFLDLANGIPSHPQKAIPSISNAYAPPHPQKAIPRSRFAIAPLHIS